MSCDLDYLLPEAEPWRVNIFIFKSHGLMLSVCKGLRTANEVTDKFVLSHSSRRLLKLFTTVGRLLSRRVITFFCFSKLEQGLSPFNLPQEQKLLVLSVVVIAMFFLCEIFSNEMMFLAFTIIFALCCLLRTSKSRE